MDSPPEKFRTKSKNSACCWGTRLLLDQDSCTGSKHKRSLEDSQGICDPQYPRKLGQKYYFSALKVKRLSTTEKA